MKKIEIEDFKNYKYISDMILSPDEKNLAYVLREMDVEKNSYNSYIYVYDIDSKKDFRLTAGAKESGFIWYDNDTILFHANRSEDEIDRSEKGLDTTSFYEIDINGGEASSAFTINANVNDIRVIDEENLLICACYNPNSPAFKLDDDVSVEQATESVKDSLNYEIANEIPIWADGHGFISNSRDRLYKYNIPNNSLTAITDEFMSVNSFEISADKQRVVFVGESFTDKSNAVDSLYIANLITSEITELVKSENLSFIYANFIADKIIAVTMDLNRIEWASNNDFHVVDLEGNITKITPDGFDFSVGAASIATDSSFDEGMSFVVKNDRLFFPYLDRYNSVLASIDIDGNFAREFTATGDIMGIDISSDCIYATGMYNYMLPEIYEHKITASSAELQTDIYSLKCLADYDDFEDFAKNHTDSHCALKMLTAHNTEVLSNYEISKPAHFQFFSNGDNLDAWIMKPANFDENKKYPAILTIHGGPKYAYGELYFHEFQVMASKGYVVFYCNPHGSDGRGDKFQDVRGKYADEDYQDLLNLVSYVKENYEFIDSDKIGITGGSYGGFMTNWAIGHTDIFKAAVSCRGIANWTSSFNLTDIDYYFVKSELKATPWTNPELLWEKSPVKYADKIKTPTLFLHSEEDYRCHVSEAVQMFYALKYFGVDSKLVIFNGESHGLSRNGKPKQRIKRLQEMMSWFDKYLV